MPTLWPTRRGDARVIIVSPASKRAVPEENVAWLGS